MKVNNDVKWAGELRPGDVVRHVMAHNDMETVVIDAIPTGRGTVLVLEAPTGTLRRYEYPVDELRMVVGHDPENPWVEWGQRKLTHLRLSRGGVK